MSAFNRFNPSTRWTPKKKLGFLIQNGPKLDFAQCRNVNIAPMQSNVLNWMKILTNCFSREVIQRTLLSGKNLLRYSSCSAILLVQRKRDPTLSFWPSLIEQDNLSKKKNLELTNGMTCRRCDSQKSSTHIYGKISNFFPEYARKILSTSPFYLSKRPSW